MSLRELSLKPDTSMIEVMRRVRQQPGTTIIRAIHRRTQASAGDYWRLQYIGLEPSLGDLVKA